MTQSETWTPSDIGSEGDAATAPKRRGRPPLSLDNAGQSSGDAPARSEPQAAARPMNSGVMTLDRDRDTAKETAPPAQTVDVQQRLRDTAETCIKFYESWRSGNDGENELTNGLHELRRVLARIEIELAASHADETAQRPIPIPLHRAHKYGDDSKR